MNPSRQKPFPQWWVIGADGSPSGPYSVNVLRELIRTHHVTWSTLAARDGTLEWRPVATWSELQLPARVSLATDAVGIGLLTIPLFACILTLTNPAFAGFGIGGSFLATCVIVALEAPKWGLSRFEAVPLVFFWPAGFGRYLVLRARAGAPQLAAAGAFVTVLVVTVFIYTSGVLSRIESYCSLSGDHQLSCSFNNKGWGTGETCAKVTLVRRRDGRAQTTKPICSGQVAPGRDRKVDAPGAFEDRPDIFCILSPGDWEVIRSKGVGGLCDFKVKASTPQGVDL